MPRDTIENLKHNKMLDPLYQAWQNGNALAARKPGRSTVNKLSLYGSYTRLHAVSRHLDEVE